MSRISPARVLYVAPTQRSYGVSAIALGLTRALQAKGLDVGFVKPIGDPDIPGDDRSVEFGRRLLGLDVPDAIPMARAESMVRTGAVDTLLEEVVATIHGTGPNLDLVVVEGSAPADGHALVADLDFAVAKALRAQVVPVVSGRDVGAAALSDVVADVLHRFGGEGGAPCAGVVIARIPEDLAPSVELKALATPTIGVVPENQALTAPRRIDVIEELGLGVIEAGDLARARVQDVVVARTVEHLVDRLGPERLSSRRATGLTWS